MKRFFILSALVLSLGLAAVTGAKAQCTSPNSAFKSGETLMYDLYFNWKFVWVKCGTAYMNTTSSTYNGHQAYKTYLITRGSKRADRFFVMRDTLTAYVSPQITPLYYKKAALEGKTYRLDEVWYSYKNGKAHLKMRHRKNKEKPQLRNYSTPYCAYDMISMLLRARSFDAKGYKVGHRIKFLMADGHSCDWQYIVYRGKKKFKMENSNVTWRCLVFSFVEKENGKEKDVVTFYITDDKNHLPVRLDMNLNFGTAKAFLTGAKGLRNPQTARIR